VAGVVLGFLAAESRWCCGPWRGPWRIPLARSGPVFVLLLAQGGEFGFVVFQGARGGGVIGAETASLLVGAVALSMLLTPAAAGGHRPLAGAPPGGPRAGRRRPAEIAEPQHAPVIICGFGRYGQIVGRCSMPTGCPPPCWTTTRKVETVRRFGWPAFYGDATRLDLLRMAGAEQARVIVVAVDDVEQSLADGGPGAQALPPGAAGGAGGADGAGEG
jgi:glutathione-regulated potassium-efflux system ancillary protein KefC